MIRTALAVLLLLTAACSADRAPARPSQAASPAPSGPGRFATVLDICSLLTPDQVEQLVALPEQRYGEDRCTWSTPLGLDARARYNLEVGVHLAADVGAAHAFLTKPPDDAFHLMRTDERPAKPVNAGVGDESFVLPPPMYSPTSLVAFRLSNAVVYVNYGRQSMSEEKSQESALKAARWIAEAMDRPRPTADPSDGRFAAPPYACSLLPPGRQPESATHCGGLVVRHARAWQGKTGVTVAKEIFAYYRKLPLREPKPLEGLGDEAFAEIDQFRVKMWVRVSNVILEIPFREESGKVTQGLRAEAAQILGRLPAS